MPRFTFLALASALALAACGSGNDPRFLLDPPSADRQVALRVSSIEVRQVSLPAYAAASEISVEDENGAVRNVKSAFWADDPVRAVTAVLARRIDEASNATAAAEPWPLDRPADVQLDVRVERMLARADGTFELAGQYAIASRDGVIREFVERFTIRAPIESEGTPAIAAAAGAALGNLADEVIARLRR